MLGESQDIHTHACWSVPPSWRVTNLAILGESRDRDQSSPCWASHGTYAHTPVGVSRHSGGSRTLPSVIDPGRVTGHTHTHLLECPVILADHTVGTIDLGTNPSDPTSECGLGNRENPSEPTTPLLSPQYGKAETSKIRGTFCRLKLYNFSYLVAPDEK